MFLQLDGQARVLCVGPTLQKLRPGRDLTGQHLFDITELLRPRNVENISVLLKKPGAKIQLRLRDEPRTKLTGLIAPLPGHDGAVINLSFGISILEAVRDYGLTSADFSGTDLAVELLYLVEAKSAAMEASRSLNLRLQDAMLAAEKQAETDTLTGLQNRRAMDHVLSHLITVQSPFSLMHLDLDFFKLVNDRFGHAAGDRVLQQAAQIMLEETRSDDVVARAGGDEFVLIFKGLQNRSALDRIAGRLIRRLQEPIPFEGQDCRVSASIGIAMSHSFARPDAVEVLRAADQALYEAKRAGRECHRFHEAHQTRAVSDGPPKGEASDAANSE